jgi:hypothetical protein
VETVDNAADPVETPLPIEGLPAEGPRRKRVAPSPEVSRRPIYRHLGYPVHRCEDCVANYVADLRSPLALLGRYERRVIGEGNRLLCAEHVQHWRERDGLPPLKIR